MNQNNKAEAERRAKLLKMRADRLPNIKKQFEENQKRNFNSNFQAGGKDDQYSNANKTIRRSSSAVTKSKATPKTTKKTTRPI